VASIFIFQAAVSSEAVSKVQKIAVGGTVSPGPGLPFAVIASDRIAVARMVSAALAAAPKANGLYSPELCASALLQRTFKAFSDQAKSWAGVVQPALNDLAADVISYATNIVPEHYGALANALKCLIGRKPTGAELAACTGLLNTVAAEADQRATRAEQLAAKFDPIVEAAVQLGAAFQATERNPPVRIVLPEIPFMCLSYGNDHLACAGDTRHDSPRQHWTVTVDPATGLACFGQDDGKGGHFFLVCPPGRLPDDNQGFPFILVKELPRPEVITLPPIGNPMHPAADPHAWFLVPGLGQRGYISSASYRRHTLDCAGDDGWQAGTPVLHWIQNGGRNQKWSFEPAPRPVREVLFYDAVAETGSAAKNVSGFQHLHGDWNAVAADLRRGIARLTSGIEITEPFIAGLQIEQAILAWADLAKEIKAAAG
jgi:hypothetical protein